MKHFFPRRPSSKPASGALIAVLAGVGIGALAAALLIVLLWGPQPTWPLRAG